LSLTVIGLI